MEMWDAAKAAVMRQIKQLLTMHFAAGASTRAIGRELGVTPSTVREYLDRAAAAGNGWLFGADVTDERLIARLFVDAGFVPHVSMPNPNWASGAPRETKRSDVNLLVLWDEYRAVHWNATPIAVMLRPNLCWRMTVRARESRGKPWIDPQHRNCATTPLRNAINDRQGTLLRPHRHSAEIDAGKSFWLSFRGQLPRKRA